MAAKFNVCHHHVNEGEVFGLRPPWPERHTRSSLTLLAIGDEVLLSFLDHCDIPQGLTEPQCRLTEISAVHRTTELEHKTTITENQSSWTHRAHCWHGEYLSCPF